MQNDLSETEHKIGHLKTHVQSIMEVLHTVNYMHLSNLENTMSLISS